MDKAVTNAPKRTGKSGHTGLPLSASGISKKSASVNSSSKGSIVPSGKIVAKESQVTLGRTKHTKLTSDSAAKAKQNDNRCYAERLSDEVLLSIFAYLGPGDLVCCARVCHHWQQISNDNVLWRMQYAKLNRDLLKRQIDNIVADRPTLYWKQLCLSESCKFRDSYALSEQKMFDPFTYLGTEISKRLRNCGVKITLDLIDGRGSHHYLRCNHSIYHRISLTARWDNSFPPIESIKSIRLLALKPLFFERKSKEWGKASPNSPCQRSLLRVYGDFSIAKLNETPYVRDSMVNHHFYESGLVIGTFHNEGGLAYICVNIPFYGILERCFRGTNLKPYDGPYAIGRFTGMPLLRGLGATLVIRHHREEIWSNQWRSGDINISRKGGCSNLELIERDKPHQHQKINKTLHTLYVAGSFMNKCNDLCIMELILNDGGSIIWTFSENVPIVSVKSEEFSYAYSGSEQLSIKHSSDRGSVSVLLSKESESEFTIIDIAITLN